MKFGVVGFPGSAITYQVGNGTVVSMPVAHAEGRYLCSDETLESLKAIDQVLFRCCEPNGSVTDVANINGSVYNIASICNKDRSVFGMIPHPERAAEAELGEKSGKLLFDS